MANDKNDNSPSRVTVYCKTPHGLVAELTNTAGEVKRVVFNGANHVSAERGLVLGYGVTENVDAEFYDAWAKANAKRLFLVNRAVYATRDVASAAAKAKELEKEKLGFEGLDPEKPGPGLKKADKPER